MSPNSPQPPERVSKLKPKITGVSNEAPNSYIDSAHQARAEKIDLDGREQFFSLRGRWSFWLLWWISGMLIFQAVVTFSIGFGWLNFLEYKWFLPIVFGQSFLQVIGMGVVIVRFLYPPTR